MPIIWNMKYILRHRVQFLSVKFCFCLFSWHITGKLLPATAVLKKSVHTKHFWRTIGTSFYSGIVEKICPLKTFWGNCHNDFEDDIHLSTFYNSNGHDSADWKCHANCCLVKLGNLEATKIIEMNSGKALKALTDSSWN